MILIDSNVIVYAHRTEAAGHEAYRRWLEACVGSEAAFGVSDRVLGEFLRVVTHPRIFKVPTPLAEAIHVVAELRAQPNCVLLTPGPRHWEIFLRLCHSVEARGSLVADAYLAALAIETGSEWITTDRGYSRFPGLRWRHPLD